MVAFSRFIVMIPHPLVQHGCYTLSAPAHIQHASGSERRQSWRTPLVSSGNSEVGYLVQGAFSPHPSLREGKGVGRGRGYRSIRT